MISWRENGMNKFSLKGKKERQQNIRDLPELCELEKNEQSIFKMERRKRTVDFQMIFLEEINTSP